MPPTESEPSESPADNLSPIRPLSGEVPPHDDAIRPKRSDLELIHCLAGGVAGC